MTEGQELENEMNALVQAQVREYSERGIRRNLSQRFPEQWEVYDQVAKNILKSLDGK